MKKLVLLLLIALSFCDVSYAALRRGDGRKVVTTAGTSVALASSQTVSTVTICAETDNTGNITVGDSPVAALATREGVPLNAGDCYTIQATQGSLIDLADIRLDSTVNGDGVTFDWIYETP